MDAVHAEEYTLEVAAVVAFPVEAAVAASSADVAVADWSVVEALGAQAAGRCNPVRVHPEAEVLPALLCKVGLSAAKDH